MIVLPSREEFIKKNFFELSFNDQEPELEKFNTLNSIELHYLAEIYNWDDGTEILNWIIESERCDKGTALMIFWRSCPDYYLEDKEAELEEYEKETLELITKIIQKFRDKRYKKSRIKYNPKKDFDIESQTDEIKNWEIPQEMRKSTKGISPIYAGAVFRFIKHQYLKNTKMLRK